MLLSAVYTSLNIKLNAFLNFNHEFFGNFSKSLLSLSLKFNKLFLIHENIQKTQIKNLLKTFQTEIFSKFYERKLSLICFLATVNKKG